MEQKKKQIVVFDFDKTLTTEHLYHELRKSTKPNFNKEWTINYIFGGEERINDLITFFSELIMSDIDLAISSHGNLAEIKKALEFVGIPLQTFIYIHGNSPSELWKTSDPEFNTSQMHNSKSKFIETQLQYKDKYNHVIFIDDDEPHGISQYYKKLSPENRQFKKRMISTILMHNVNSDGSGIKTNDTGMNEDDQTSIWRAIGEFNSQKGGYKKASHKRLKTFPKKNERCNSCGGYI
jgi:hypothetical protein